LTTPLRSNFNLQDLDLDIRHSALIVIDMQNAYCDPHGEFARIMPDPHACSAVIQPCVQAISAARHAGVPIIYTIKVGLTASVPTVSFKAAATNSDSVLRVGTWSAEIVDAIKPNPEELVIPKLAYSAFFGTPLDAILSHLAIRRLVLVGVTTSICVESTARDAAQRGLGVFVVEDATAEWDPVRKQQSLDQMSYAFGRAIPLTDLLQAWDSTDMSV